MPFLCMSLSTVGTSVSEVCWPSFDDQYQFGRWNISAVVMYLLLSWWSDAARMPKLLCVIWRFYFLITVLKQVDLRYSPVQIATERIKKNLVSMHWHGLHDFKIYTVDIHVQCISFLNSWVNRRILFFKSSHIVALLYFDQHFSISLECVLFLLGSCLSYIKIQLSGFKSK